MNRITALMCVVFLAGFRFCILPNDVFPGFFHQVVMNRIATLLKAGAGKYHGEIDSEWVLGHHLLQHRISVRCCCCI